MNQHNIPTEPQDDPGETIMAALAHGMTGNPHTGLTLLEEFFETRSQLVSLCAALAATNAMLVRKHAPDADGFGLMAIHDGVLTDTREMPPGERFAAQFTVAWINGDAKTAYALFDALHSDGTEQAAEHVATGVWALYEMSVASMQALTGRTP